jgi:hypothetical protein
MAHFQMLASRALFGLGALTLAGVLVCLWIHFRLPRWQIRFRVAGGHYAGTYEATGWNSRDAIGAMHRRFQELAPGVLLIVESFERIPIQ